LTFVRTPYPPPLLSLPHPPPSTPSSPPFPYTTLFRSSDAGLQRAARTGLRAPRRRGPTAPQAVRTRRRESSRLRCSSSRARSEIDRKSTRLNSSHVSISYAVFCLKKKTKLR